MKEDERMREGDEGMREDERMREGMREDEDLPEFPLSLN